jgi:hypothetical protein
VFDLRQVRATRGDLIDVSSSSYGLSLFSLRAGQDESAGAMHEVS